MLIDENVEIAEKNINSKKMSDSGSKNAFFNSLTLNIKGNIANENRLSILIKKYCIAILSISSNQYIYIDIVNKTI